MRSSNMQIQQSAQVNILYVNETGYFCTSIFHVLKMFFIQLSSDSKVHQARLVFSNLNVFNEFSSRSTTSKMIS